MILRSAALTALLLAGTVCVRIAARTEKVPPRERLSAFPQAIGVWHGKDAPEFSPEIRAVLGADDYVNRVYRASSGGDAGLYIGYYESQQQGDTIHSPLNCLPGAGWQPLSRSYITIPVAPGRSIRVNQFVIEKGLDRQVVLYWYQSHGRVEPNEYWSKLYLVSDAVRLNRTDAALVRVIAPVSDAERDAVTAASDVAIGFVKLVFPLLENYLPS